MELLQLKYFCDAATSENFSKTAEKFGVPPSCISQSIKRLENELSVKLFTRSSNKVILNDKGIEFYEKVSKGLNLITNAATAVADDGQAGEINICINSNRRIVMQAVENFKAIYPHVNITTKSQYHELLDCFDIIVDCESPILSSYKKTELLSEMLYLAISKDDPLSQAPDFDISMVADRPFISINKPSKLYDLTKEICADKGFTPNIAVLSDDPFYVRKYVELNFAVTVSPAFSWYGQFSNNVKLFPLKGYSRNTFIYTDPKKYLPICAKNFIKFLKSEYEKEYQKIENNL